MVASRETQIRHAADVEVELPAGAIRSNYDGTRNVTGRARRLVQSSDAMIARIDSVVAPPAAPDAKPKKGKEVAELLLEDHFPQRILGAAAVEKASA